MRVRIVQDRYLAGYGLLLQGDELDLPQEVARQLIQQEIAISPGKAKEAEEPDTAARTLDETLSATETVSKPRKRRKRY
jgi:hypothetical protein